MLLTTLGVIAGIAFIGKIVFQILLDGVSRTETGEKINSNYRLRFFLPYYEAPSPEYLWMKKLCNISYYVFIASIVILVIIKNLS